MLVLAHGLGDAADLPLPFGIVLWLVGAAVLATAALSSRRARAGALPTAGAGIPAGAPGTGGSAADPRTPRSTVTAAPAAARVAAARPWAVRALQALMLLLLATVLGLAAAGPDTAAVNPAPRLVYVVFWAGLVPLSLLLGGWWRLANPLRLLAAGIARLVGDPHDATVRPLSPSVGVRPAAALLALFTWGELALPEQPRLTVLVVLLVLLATLAGSVRHGRAWFEAGDPFETYSRTLGALAPFGPARGGGWGLRSPRVPLATLAAPPGLGAVVAVLVGADLFDGVLATVTWQNLKVGLPVTGRVLVDTAGLAASMAAVGLLVWASTRSARALLPALLPVVAAYAVAHYVPVLLMEAEVALAQVSDPLGRGWDLFGTAGAAATYEALPGAVLAVGLLLVLLAGHLAAVVVASDRATLAYGRQRAAAVQLPLRALLLASALGSIAVRFLGG